MDVGDKIFYPMHGAGLVKSIEIKSFGDNCERFYVIELPFEQNLHIFIKEKDIDKFEFRELVNEDTLDRVYNYINIFEIAYVFKGLSVRNEKGKLSLKELFMLNLAKRILISEFVMVSGFPKNKINKIIDYSIEH